MEHHDHHSRRPAHLVELQWPEGQRLHRGPARSPNANLISNQRAAAAPTKVGSALQNHSDNDIVYFKESQHPAPEVIFRVLGRPGFRGSARATFADQQLTIRKPLVTVSLISAYALLEEL